MRLGIDICVPCICKFSLDASGYGMFRKLNSFGIPANYYLIMRVCVCVVAGLKGIYIKA